MGSHCLWNRFVPVLAAGQINHGWLTVTQQSFYSMILEAFKAACSPPADENTDLIFVALVHSQCLGAELVPHSEVPHQVGQVNSPDALC